MAYIELYIGTLKTPQEIIGKEVDCFMDDDGHFYDKEMYSVSQNNKWIYFIEYPQEYKNICEYAELIPFTFICATETVVFSAMLDWIRPVQKGKPVVAPTQSIIDNIDNTRNEIIKIVSILENIKSNEEEI